MKDNNGRSEFHDMKPGTQQTLRRPVNYFELYNASQSPKSMSQSQVSVPKDYRKPKPPKGRLFSFRRLNYYFFKTPLLLRVFAGVGVLIIVAEIIMPLYQGKGLQDKYDLTKVENRILTQPIGLYAQKLTYNQDSRKYVFNDGYSPSSSEVAGEDSSPKVTAEFDAQDTKKVTITDPVNNVSIGFTPRFKTENAQKNQNRVVYPINNLKATTVFTAKGTGIKEDIILHEFQGNTKTFEYDLSLADGTEARLEGDGSLAVYGVSSVFLGNVTAATEKDKELLDKSRKNGEKNQLLFRIPAPFVVEENQNSSKAKVWYSLQNNVLTIHADNLQEASYPLSIDPSVYVESARQLMRGNNETNTNFDVDNQLIQKSHTTGARIDAWESTTGMNSGTWNHATAAAGGYVYRAGGRVDPSKPQIVAQQQTLDNSNGTSFTMNMPSVRPAGDLYIAMLCHNGSSGSNMTPPSGGGWTEYADLQGHAAYYKIGTNVSGGNEAASYQWTGPNEQYAGVIIRVSGFDSADIVSGTEATTSVGGAGGIPSFPAVTPDRDATLVIRSTGFDNDNPSATGWVPAGHTKIASGNSNGSANANACGYAAASLDNPPASGVSTGTQSLVNDGSVNDDYGASTIAINPVAVTAGPQTAVNWAQFNDSTKAIDSPNPGTGACSGWCTNSVYDLPTPLVGHSLVAYNGFLYALGGRDSSCTAGNGTGTTGTCKTVYIAKLGANGEPQLWHPSGGTAVYWYRAGDLTTERAYTGVVAYNNKMYLLGGLNGSNTTSSTVYAADILPTGNLGSWSTSGMQALPTARYGHSVQTYNDTIYLIGGNASFTGTPVNTTHYSKLNSDGTMNTWTAGTTFTAGRQSMGGTMTAIWGAYIYLAGGCSAVNGSGYCTTIEDDTQLASINADGSLAPWNEILDLTNQRVGYTFIAWQDGLYRLGGCTQQNTTTGNCISTLADVDFGEINQDGDASTVNNSEPSGSGDCITPNYTNCDLPPAGDNAGQGGQMSSMVVINNGYIYNIGGCTSPASACTAMSGNVSYSSISSTGALIAPATCGGTSYGHWCVDSTNRINGTAGVGAGAATVFNNTIYVIGGTNGSTWNTNVYYTSVNSNGSLTGAWTAQTFANLDIDVDTGTAGYQAIGYSYTFTRANPSSASTYPGNLYLLGGCTGGGGIGCSNYYSRVFKCNITPSGPLETADANDCTTSGQLEIDADNVSGGNQGLGLMAGTIYANRIYLVGGSCAATGAAGNPCGSTYAAQRKDTIFARIDDSNNIVAESGGVWQFTTAQMSPVRRRAVSFGYNGYIYSLAGFSGTSSLQDLLFSKINVSTGDIGAFSSSGVVVTPRWDLRAIVSNGYVYALGGCADGDAPSDCTDMQEEIQTFQLYNNDSGSPVGYSASAYQFATDRYGGSSAIYNGYIYVAGGCTGTAACTSPTNSVQFAALDAYGNISGAWSAGGNLPASVAWGQLEVAGGSLYYVGGQSSAGTAQTAVYYTTGISSGNPTWGTASNGLPAARTMLGAAVWDNRIYAVAGSNAGTGQTSVYVSPQLNSGGDIGSAWTTSGSSINVARSGNTVIAYANNLYSLGGYDGSNYLSDVQFASLGYKTGTISQSGTTVTGSGTTFTSAMVGSTLQYSDGSIATISAYSSATSITVSVSKTVPASSGYTILDGSVGSWSYTTSLPTPISQADGFAVNGYMYLVGGRSTDTDCTSNTLVAPISANTTIASGNNPTGVGDWYETNQRYTGDRYGNAVAYSNGKIYVTGGGCEQFPSVSGSPLTQQFNTDTTTHNVTMPATVDPGDLLLVLFSSDTNDAVTTPGGGWAAISTQTRGTAIRGSVYALKAAGTEDGSTVNFVTATINQASSQVYRIPAGSWYDDGTVTNSVEAASVDPGGTTNAPNPPSLNPTNWDVADTLWISYAAGSEYASVSSYPSNYTNGTHNGSNGGVNVDRATTSSARLESRAASEDPGAFGMPSNSNGVAFTIAIRPATVTYTGANSTSQTAVYSQPQVAKYSRLIDTDTDVFPNAWLLNGLDNSIGARWQTRYRTMHDLDTTVNPNEDCGTSGTMAQMTGWGQETNFGNTALGDVNPYIPKNSSGGNINCARYYYFSISIDASQTFGYPEDVTRGPTITDLSLFFTSDPSKRLRHGKTFTGGEQQPLDTPCRQSVDSDCPLP